MIENPENESPSDNMETLRAAMEVPAIMASMVNVALTTTGLRLSFAERIGPDEKAHFRSAVLIPVETALSMISVIQGLLERNKAQDGD
jgi:hypothetical protein